MRTAREEDRVVAIDRPVRLPDEMRADQKREHQAGEEARPRLLQAEQDELGERRRQLRERAPHAKAERIEQRADGMRRSRAAPAEAAIRHDASLRSGRSMRAVGDAKHLACSARRIEQRRRRCRSRRLWQPSAASREKSAARRPASRCAATSSRSRIGVMPLISATSSACARIRPISSAFCSPVEESAAGMSFSAKMTSRSLRCGPSERAARGAVGGARSPRARRDTKAPSRRRCVRRSRDRSRRRGAIRPAGKATASAASAQRSAQREAPPSRRARAPPRRRARRAPPRPRRARPALALSSSSRLRCVSRRSKSRARRPCAASMVSTRRSRKRRRSAAGPVKSPSIAGVSQSMRR